MKNNLIVLSIMIIALTSCMPPPPPSSNDVRTQQQEQALKEGAAQVSIPAIVHFREQRLLKEIYELRDQEGLVTYTYLYNEMQGKLIFLCSSIGFGIPYATQFTQPEAMQRYHVLREGGTQTDYNYGTEKLPQSEPNGLFPPSSAEGTWVLCLDPNGKLQYSGKKVLPMYIEPRVLVSPFKLPKGLALYP